MPLAHRIRVVAGVAEQEGEGDDAVREVTLVARPSTELDGASPLPAHPRDVVVVPAEEHGPGRGAHGSGVELGEAHPSRREGVDVGRGDVAAVAPQVGVGQVVGDDEQDVGRLVPGTRSVRRPGAGHEAQDGRASHEGHEVGGRRRMGQGRQIGGHGRVRSRADGRSTAHLTGRYQRRQPARRPPPPRRLTHRDVPPASRRSRAIP